MVFRLDDTERIQTEIERLKRVIAKVEASMDGIPENCADNRLFVLEQLKSELAALEELLLEYKA